MVSSSYKQYQVLKLKGQILGLQALSDEDAEAALDKIEGALVKRYGKKDGEKILLDAVKAADAQMSDVFIELAKKNMPE